MRDHRAVSISVKDLKNELTPILTRDGLEWSTWWKSTRKNLSSAKRIVTHLGKKGVYPLQLDQTANAPDAWLERIQKANHSQALLLLTDELDLVANSEDKEKIRGWLIDKTVAQRVASEPQARLYTECVLALCRLIDAPANADRERVAAGLENVDFAGISLSREFDHNLQFALGILDK